MPLREPRSAREREEDNSCDMPRRQIDAPRCARSTNETHAVGQEPRNVRSKTVR